VKLFFSPAGVKVDFNSTLYCKVSNNYTQQIISNYNVSFYEEGVYLGSNLTNLEGYAQFLISENDEAGTRSITCNIQTMKVNIILLPQIMKKLLIWE
jgi:hypothetical protein